MIASSVPLSNVASMEAFPTVDAVHQQLPKQHYCPFNTTLRIVIRHYIRISRVEHSHNVGSLPIPAITTSDFSLGTNIFQKG